jgi:hypothetical protein
MDEQLVSSDHDDGGCLFKILKMLTVCLGAMMASRLRTTWRGL